MLDKEKVVKGLEICSEHGSWHGLDCELNEAYKDCPYRGCETGCIVTIAKDAIALLKEQEAVKPKTIPEELKLKMWNALYAKEDKFEKNYIGTKEQDSWFLIYRPWLQAGFNLTIKAIADWEGVLSGNDKPRSH